MRIPKTLKIGGHIYQVKLIPELDKCGATNRDNNTISISKELPKDQQDSTLLHEIIHALNNEIEHTLVDGLAEGLYQVLSDNDLLK